MSIFDNLFNKKEKKNPLDLYQLIAVFNRLIHQKDKLYTNSQGEKFFLTRYGFVTVEQHNLKLQTEQQKRHINNLETDVIVLEKNLEKVKKELSTIKKEVKEETEYIKNNTSPIIKYSFKSKYDKLKKNYLNMMINNHNLIVRIKQLKSEIKKLTTELIDEKGKNKIAQKNIAPQTLTDEDINTKINAAIMYAENNQIGKMLEKLKSVVAHQENLKQKSHNQKALITRLEMINKNLEEELYELKMKNLKK